MSLDKRDLEVFNASIGLCLEPTCEAKDSLDMVLTWMTQFAGLAPRNMNMNKRLGIQLLIKKISADVLDLGSVEQMFGNLESASPARQDILLDQIMEHYASIKEEPEEYHIRGNSVYYPNMISWVHETVCDVHPLDATGEFMAKSIIALDKWAASMARIDEILGVCGRLVRYRSVCVRLDQARKEHYNLMRRAPPPAAEGNAQCRQS